MANLQGIANLEHGAVNVLERVAGHGGGSAAPIYVPPPLAPGMGSVGGMVYGAQRTFGSVQSVIGMAGMASLVFGFLGTVPFIGAPFKYLGKITGKPGEVLGGNSVAGLVGKAREKTGALIGEARIESAAKAITASAAFAGAKQGINNATVQLGGIAQRVQETASSLPGAQTVSRWRASHVAYLQNQAVKAHGDALSHLDKAIGALPADSFTAPRAVLQEARTRLADGGVQAANRSFLRETGAKYSAAMAAVDTKTLDEASQTALKTVGKSVSEYGQSVLSTHRATGAAQMRGNIVEGIKGLPARVGEMTGTEALYKGMYLAGQAAAAYGTARMIGSGISAMKHMYASITGTDIKKVSTFKMLFGSLPETMKGTRRQYLLSTFPQAAINVVGMFGNHLMNRGGGGWKTATAGFVIPSLLGPVGSLFSDQNNMLSVYRKLAQAQAGGIEVPAGGFAALMAHASPAAEAMGIDNPALIQVAKLYADARTPAGIVLQEIENGVFAQRVAQAKALVAPVVASQATEPRPITIGHTTIAPRKAAESFASSASRAGAARA